MEDIINVLFDEEFEGEEFWDNAIPDFDEQEIISQYVFDRYHVALTRVVAWGSANALLLLRKSGKMVMGLLAFEVSRLGFKKYKEMKIVISEYWAVPRVHSEQARIDAHVPQNWDHPDKDPSDPQKVVYEEPAKKERPVWQGAKPATVGGQPSGGIVSWVLEDLQTAWSFVPSVFKLQ